MKKWIMCRILGMHSWTSRAEQAEPAKFNSFDQFLEYNKVYCSRCNKLSSFSIREQRRWTQEQVREKIKKVREL